MAHPRDSYAHPLSPSADSQAIARQTLRALRAARRRHHVEEVDVMEILYRLYVGVIFGGWGLALLAGVIADSHLDHQAVERVTQDGPAIIGVCVAFCLALSLRAGWRGGLLALLAADVQHILLAPIDRGWALRVPALRQLRSAGFFGLAGGLIVANFAFRRLPGSSVEWLSCLALFGALVPIWILATAMLASGRRLNPLAANLTGLALLAWSLSDYLLGVTSSPMTMLGDLATLPLHDSDVVVEAIMGAGVVAATVWAGLRSVGGLSLEAARRRAGLAAELRFAATVQDVRTVVLLRRQLSSERPRRHPWWRLGDSLFFPPPGLAPGLAELSTLARFPSCPRRFDRRAHRAHAKRRLGGYHAPRRARRFGPAGRRA